MTNRPTKGKRGKAPSTSSRAFESAAAGRSGSAVTAAASARDVVRRLRDVVAAASAEGSGAPAIQVAAERMGTTVRTLQRRLRAQGVTYAAVVAGARAAAARQMLKNLHRSIGDIARSLGYSDHAHFTRAFQRWTGLTPRDFRRRRGGNDGRLSEP